MNNEKTIAELEEELERIENKHKHWRSHPNQDGSYEAAISHDGYYIILGKIERLMKNE
jgi:hypothetical protein